MIVLDTLQTVRCATCGKEAYRQNVPVFHRGQGEHIIAYETHDPDLISEQHRAALGRLDRFYAGVHGLRADLKGLPTEQRQVEHDGIRGEFVEFDFEPVRPDACNVRTDLVPLADLRAFGREVEIKLPRRKLEGLQTTTLLEEFKERAPEVLEVLRAQRLSGEI